MAIRAQRGWVCLAGAAVFALLFDPDLFSAGYAENASIYPVGAAFLVAALELVLVAGSVFLLLSAASGRSWLFAPVVLALFALCDPASFFASKFQVALHTAVSAFLESGDKEWGRFGTGLIVSFTTALAAAASLILAVATSPHTARSKPLHLGVAAAMLAALLLDALFFGGRARAKVTYDYLPLGLASQSLNYIRQSRTYANKLDVSEFPATLRAANDDLIFIFVIGESARGQNFSLNGYPRPTNPELSKLTNLISFTDVTSAATTTRRSVPVMLTRMTADEARPLMVGGGAYNDVYAPETSFISIFNKLGFETFFLANWGKYGMWATSETILVEEAKHSHYSDSWVNLTPEERTAQYEEFGITDPAWFAKQLDETVLLFFDHYRTRMPGRSLFVMHPYGSHFVYYFYPKRFEVFTPVCDFNAVGYDLQNCAGPPIVNAYDNTIVYMDWVLSQIIERVRDRNAVLLYVGDHGESLGEQGYFMHSHDKDWERHVPLIVWASDRYLADADNRRCFEALRENKDRSVSHDFIFHTTLELAGIESAEVVQPALSLCRPPERARAEAQ